jgi:hypothetical protein
LQAGLFDEQPVPDGELRQAEDFPLCAGVIGGFFETSSSLARAVWL